MEKSLDEIFLEGNIKRIEKENTEEINKPYFPIIPYKFIFKSISESIKYYLSLTPNKAA